jgi:hypothetical protein
MGGIGNMRYYCENLDGIIVNTGTFQDTFFVEEGHDVFEISKEEYDKIVVGVTTNEEVERLSEE